MADRRDYRSGGGTRDNRDWGGRSRDSRGGDRDQRRGAERDGDWRGPPRGRPPRSADRAAQPDDGGPSLTNVWIGGLPSNITVPELEKLGSKFGPILKVSVKHSQVDTYAFLTFGQPAHAKYAIRDLDQTNPFKTGTIKVAPASKKSDSVRPDDERADGRRGDWDAARPERRRERTPRRRSRSRSARDRPPRADRDRPADRERDRLRDDNGRGHADRRGDRDRDRDRDLGRDDRGGGARDRVERDRRRDDDRDRDRGDRDRDRNRDKGRSPPPRSPGRTRHQVPRLRVRVYLSQLPRDMEVDELQEIAGEYGRVLDHELHREGAYKCGWVEYSSKAEAEAAVRELDDRQMEDWNMRLQAYMYPGNAA